MNVERFNKMIATIEDIKFPSDFQSFGGGNLIVTSNPNRKRYDYDVVICTKYAGPISWLIYQLNDVYKDSVYYSNKYSFYQLVGSLIQKHLNDTDPIHEIMLNIVYDVHANCA